LTGRPRRFLKTAARPGARASHRAELLEGLAGGRPRGARPRAMAALLARAARGAVRPRGARAARRRRAVAAGRARCWDGGRQRGQLLRGGGTTQPRERLEQARLDRLGEDVVSDRSEVHQRSRLCVGGPKIFFPAIREKGSRNLAGCPPSQAIDTRSRARGATVEGPQRRQLLVSKGWIQAVLLVVLCGFFILGLLAYRTYMAHPPVPGASSMRRARPLSPAGHLQGPAGLPAQRPHGVRVGVRPRGLPRPGLHRRLPAPLVRSRQGAPTAATLSDSAARRTIEDFRTNRYDKARDADAHRAAGTGLPRPRGVLQPLLLGPDDEHGLRPERGSPTARSCAS
jgi:hypothetical protein